MWKDFKEFAFKGNAVDLAIGVVIGTAFSKIVSSIVDDLITPILGILFGWRSVDYIWQSHSICGRLSAYCCLHFLLCQIAQPDEEERREQTG